MTQKSSFKTIIYIGRFQPPHNGHLETIQRALQIVTTTDWDGRVIVVIGSTNQPRTYKNPFSFEERSEMIRSSIGVAGKLHILPVEDSIYNDQAWAESVQKIVAPYLHGRVGIIGHEKDESSYYLKMFPQWDFIPQEMIEPLDATQVRNIYFSEKCNFNFLTGVLPERVVEKLKIFKTTTEYEQIIKERKFLETYKKQFEQLPYPPTFITTDAVVVQSAHVLLIRRRSEPGKGLWAFPGGFLNAKTDKSLEDCMIRELQEETGIKVPEKVLRGNIKKKETFDAINRSERGRTITHAFLIELESLDRTLPKIKGSDDADKAKWIPISEVKRNECFEDHYDILTHFLGR